MKRIALIIALSLLSLSGFSQYSINSLALNFGAGLATDNNYNTGLTGGLQYIHGMSSKLGIGASLMYQGYEQYYKGESPAGNAGTYVLNKSGYIFFSPKLDFCPGRGKVHFYFAPGVGFNMGGTETTHKWDNTHGSAALGNYDSTINTSSNITKLAFRINFGLVEYAHAGGNWFVTFTEDFGFLATDLTKSGSTSDDSRTLYSPHDTKPAYISLLIGIDHRKESRHEGRGILR